MAHDEPGRSHWHEPKAGENAGLGRFKRAAMPYDRFMEAEGVPVFRGIGVRTVRDLPLSPWKRTGGRGTYVQLYGTETKWGMYVVEVPARGTLPTDVTAVAGAAASTAVAAIVVKSEASRAALMPTLIAFLNLFKSSTSLCVGLV